VAKKYFQAEDVFKDFDDEIKEKIFSVASGKMVYFPKNKNRRRISDIEKLVIIKMYAVDNKNSYKKIGDDWDISGMRVCQIVNDERKNFSKERIVWWRDNYGLSLREIARLFKKSYETIRQILNGE